MVCCAKVRSLASLPGRAQPNSHSYNESQAVAVLQVVPKSLEEVRFLYGRLEEEAQHG